MIKGKKLLEVVIPNYIEKIQLSKARRPKYYKKGDKIPKRYSAKLGTEYEFRIFKNKDLLFSITTGELVLANPIACGTPKYMNIKGNSVYSGFGTPHQRNLIVNSIKADFNKFFVNKRITEFPIIFEILVYAKHNEQNSSDEKKTQDLDNLVSLYSKCTLDLMTRLKVIPDDNLKYVRGIVYDFIPSDERKLIINCYKYDNIDKNIIHPISIKSTKPNKTRKQHIYKNNSTKSKIKTS